MWRITQTTEIARRKGNSEESQYSKIDVFTLFFNTKEEAYDYVYWCFGLGSGVGGIKRVRVDGKTSYIITGLAKTTLELDEV